MIQKDSYKHETYFDIRSLVTAELEELWSWYCFEKVALGVETLQECSTESTLRIFLAQKPLAVQRKDFGEFSKSICSKGKNQNPRGRYPIGRELACQLARTFPYC